MAIKRNISSWLLCFTLFIAAFPAHGQSVYLDYIEKYKEMAIDQMHRHGIPASITLAQALLESAAGKSQLAVIGNNHFGIKVGSAWNGEYMLKDDDAKNEKFRKYNDVAHSYEDHSLFLKRPRYAHLFSLPRTDYKGWAKGLKAAGYATNPAYAQHLITLIERYDLMQYDFWAARTAASIIGPRVDLKPTSAVGSSSVVVHRCNQNYYIIASATDTYKSIGVAMGVNERKLRKYNEVNKRHRLQVGEVVYLEKKRKKAAKDLKGKWHSIRSGESIHSISQLYGVRMKTLYKLNHLSEDYLPIVGQQLRIR